MLKIASRTVYTPCPLCLTNVQIDIWKNVTTRLVGSMSCIHVHGCGAYTQHIGVHLHTYMYMYTNMQVHYTSYRCTHTHTHVYVNVTWCVNNTQHSKAHIHVLNIYDYDDLYINYVSKDATIIPFLLLNLTGAHTCTYSTII